MTSRNTDRSVDRGAEHTVGSRTNTCANCKFCGLAVGLASAANLVCRRNPPRVHAALVMATSGPEWSGMSGWPNVSNSDWCGEWAAQQH